MCGRIRGRMGLEPVADKIEKDGTPPALVVGYVLTGIWAVILAAYLFWPSSGRWTKLLEVDPNAFGDFLAGAFAPLAFLWLVVTVMLQSRELRLQREELKQNRAALELQATELHQSVKELQNQNEILREQQRLTERRELSTGLAIEVENIAESVSARVGDCYLVLSSDGGGVRYIFGDHQAWKRPIHVVADRLQFALENLIETRNSLEKRRFAPLSRSKGFQKLAAVQSQLVSVLRDYRKGDEALQRLVERSGMEKLSEEISRIMELVREVPEG